jgi:hypothetical protein
MIAFTIDQIKNTKQWQLYKITRDYPTDCLFAANQYTNCNTGFLN